MTASQKKIKPGGKRQRGGRSGEPVYSEQLANQICEQLTAGLSLRAICRAPGMPTEGAVRLWTHEDSERGRAFATRYARARSIGYERMVEELLEIADDTSFLERPELASAMVQQQRLAAEMRRWLLSKVFPKLYGDKVEITGDPDAPIVTRIELVPVQPRQLEAKTIEHDANDTSDE